MARRSCSPENGFFRNSPCRSTYSPIAPIGSQCEMKIVRPASSSNLLDRAVEDPPVEAGQEDVEDQEIVMVAADVLERRRSTLGAVHLEPATGEQVPNDA